jgi:hypothetical protein
LEEPEKYKKDYDKKAKKKKDSLISFVKQLIWESMESFIKEGEDFVNSKEGVTDNDNLRKFQEKAEEVIVAAAIDESNPRKRKSANPAPGKASTKFPKNREIHSDLTPALHFCVS